MLGDINIHGSNQFQSNLKPFFYSFVVHSICTINPTEVDHPQFNSIHLVSFERINSVQEDMNNFMIRLAFSHIRTSNKVSYAISASIFLCSVGHFIGFEISMKATNSILEKNHANTFGKSTRFRFHAKHNAALYILRYSKN